MNRISGSVYLTTDHERTTLFDDFSSEKCDTCGFTISREPAMPRIDESRPFIPVRIAVLTVSDTRTPADDKSGDTLVQLLQADGHLLAGRAIAADDVGKIQAHVKAWIADPEIDVVITTGGTGFTGRDVTPEAIKPLFEKEIEGFSTVFHLLSFQKIETSTIQSRACGGLAHGTYIFCLPGSPGACKDGWSGILKWQLDNRHRPCNFVEIMPRLEEHRRTDTNSPPVSNQKV